MEEYDKEAQVIEDIKRAISRHTQEANLTWAQVFGIIQAVRIELEQAYLEEMYDEEEDD